MGRVAASWRWVQLNLPQGRTLPDSAWRARHRAIVVLLLAHAAVVPVVAVARGLGPLHATLESLVLPVTALAAVTPRLGRAGRTAAASLGLLSASGILVHLSGGLIEMHFHFFVMVGVVALYQDWIPFLTAIGYVLLHHGVVGALDAGSVYNHGPALESPWKWAAVHAAFIGAMSVGCLVTWRFNEMTLSERDHAESRLRDESHITGTLHRVGQTLTRDLDTHRVVQAITDAATEAVGAAFGAFFYKASDPDGEAYLLFSLSGAPIEAFERFGLPRNTPIFSPTFAGEAPVRLDDVTQDPRYGRMGPHHGMPEGHLPVRSYLAVPVQATGGGVLGALFFGHPQPAQFSETDERVVVGIASQAAIAFENARLYESERQARTEAEAAGARLAVLAEASKILNSSLEVEHVLHELGHLITPSIADYCVLDLVREDGSVRRVATAAAAPQSLWTTHVPPDTELGVDEPDATVAWYAAALPDHDYRAMIERDPPASTLRVPVDDRDGRLGTLHLACSGTSGRDVSEADRPFAEELARRIAAAVANAHAFARQRSLAETLQHSLLPERLPDIPGLQTAARYVAGGPGVEVGGDWYDVIQLAGGRIGLAIGDVVGKGERAAALMGHLRSALRAYCMDGRSPAEVMERLNALLLDTGPDQMATVVYVLLDPETGAMRFVNAGHPPPLLVSPDGAAVYLEDTRGMPVGALPGAQYAESTATLPPGGRLVLYTDGLVEDRVRSIDVGLERLRRAVAAAPDDLDLLCTSVLEEALVDRDSPDDTAILVVRLQVLGPSLDLRVPSTANMLAPLRTTMRRWLAERGAAEDETFEVLVAAGELFTNAIRHGAGHHSHFDVHAEMDDGVTVCVRNHGAWRERRGDVGGRGLAMVEEYSDRVDIIRGDSHTEVRMHRALRGTAVPA